MTLKSTKVLKILTISILTAAFSSAAAFSQINAEVSGLVFTAGTDILISIHDKTDVRAPSPVSFVLGGGCDVQISPNFLLSPALNFWWNWFLFDENRAYPAEIEHRTACVLNFLLDAPALYKWKLGEMYEISAGGGIALNLRVPIRATGTSKDDSGEVKDIGKYLWKNFSFFYVSAQVNFDVELHSGGKVGLGIRYHCPLTNVTFGSPFADLSLFTALIRVTLPR